MKILIVGAGATGGYLGVKWIRAGRNVTFLVRPATMSRLDADGIRIRSADGGSVTRVPTVTRDQLSGPYELVVLAVRSDAVEAAIDDIGGAVGAGTRIVPLANGMAHLSALTAAFGHDVVLGAAAKLATSLLSDGTIDEVAPGVQLALGSLDGCRPAEIDRLATELAVDGIAVTVTGTVVAAMWEKFAFITSTAVLTCLAGGVIGAVARAAGGISLAERVLDEVDSVAAAEGYPLGGPARTALVGLLTDPTSKFGPSMFRDLHAGRAVETSVFGDLADRARRHGIATPLLDACTVVIDVRAHRRDGAQG